MKTKLTIYDCFKYPNAVIREYKNGKQLEGEYINILQLITFKCLTVWNEPNKQIKDANKYLSNCKLVLKDAFETIKSTRVSFDKIYMSELIDNLRADNGLGLCAGGASRLKSFNPPLMFNRIRNDEYSR